MNQFAKSLLASMEQRYYHRADGRRHRQRHENKRLREEVCYDQWSK